MGCRLETPDHDNYRFSSKDAPGKIYIPKVAPPPPPPCPNDFGKSFEIEAKEAMRTRQQSVEVANRFFRTVGAVGRTGRFIPTIIDTKYWFAKLYEITTGFEISAARDYKYRASSRISSRFSTTCTRARCMHGRPARSHPCGACISKKTGASRQRFRSCPGRAG